MVYFIVSEFQKFMHPEYSGAVGIQKLAVGSGQLANCSRVLGINCQLFFLTLLCFFITDNVCAQNVDVCKIYGSIYLEKTKAFADYSVYIEETEAFADLVVYKEDSEIFADKSGLWYFIEQKAFADYSIYIEQTKAFADFSVYYIEVESFAGCD